MPSADSLDRFVYIGAFLTLHLSQILKHFTQELNFLKLYHTPESNQGLDFLIPQMISQSEQYT